MFNWLASEGSADGYRAEPGSSLLGQDGVDHYVESEFDASEGGNARDNGEVPAEPRGADVLEGRGVEFDVEGQVRNDAAFEKGSKRASQI